jgi:ubiquinone/menaquinone biosynthesis C-methylase UbiE
MKRTLEPEVMDTAEDAEEYDAMDFTETDTRFAEAAATLLGEARGARVIDIGTGPARIPLIFLSQRPDCSVLAVDMAEEMLRVAARNIDAAGLSHACQVARMDAKALDVPPGSFDLVMSNSIAHHIPEPLDLFREITRVAGRHGAVLVRDLLRPESQDAAWAIVHRVAAGDSERQKRLFFDSLCAALTLDEVRGMVSAAGLEGAAVVQSSDRHWSVERPRRGDAPVTFTRLARPW